MSNQKFEKIHNGIYAYTFGMPEEHTPSQLFKAQLTPEKAAVLSDADTPITREDIAFRKISRGCRLELPLGANEQIYGFGLQLNSFRQNGKKKTTRVNADPVVDTGDSHAPVPLYVSTAGYMVLIDTFRYASFYVGSHAHLSQGSVGVGKAATNTDELYAGHMNNKESFVAVDVPAAEGVTIYVFAGPTMLEAVQRYNLFSGGGYLPPVWSLGVWYRTYVWADSAKVKEQCEEMRREHIPCDVFGLEPGWQTASYSCSYMFEKGRFPDPEAFIKDMQEQHFRLNLWEHIYVHPTSPVYEELKPYSGDYQVWGGLVPDLSCSEASDAFARYHEQSLVDKGVSGFKLDECDNSDFIGSPWSYPEISQFPSGMDGEQMHSAMGNLYAQTLEKAFNSSKQRTVGLIRSAGTFAAPHPFVLYSDLYDHRVFIRALVNSGFSGLSWMPEVRQTASLEDLYRRIGTVIFSPVAQIDGWMIPNMPWKQWDEHKNREGIMLENADEVTDNVREMLKLRMQLVPYLYTAYHDYHTTGKPPFRALVLEHPEDEKTYNCDMEYYMGDSLLVAPMVAGETERTVYLPEGGWYDFHTGEYYAGGQEYTVKADLTTTPVFVKEGTLLPLAEPQDYWDPANPISLTFRRFGEGDLSCVLYEDDGQTEAYRDGMYNRISVAWTQDAATPTVVRTGKYSGQLYQIAQQD